MSMTVSEFCHRHSISRAFFYLLASKGEAPRTFKVGRLVRISQEAEREWIKSREAAASMPDGVAA